MPAVIQLEDFHKTYRTGEIEVRAVRGVNLTVEPGEFVAIMGSSGSGKSTLMKVLSGACPPEEGAIELDGQPFVPENPLHARRCGIAMIYQELTLAPHLSVEENIVLGSEPSRLGWLRRACSSRWGCGFRRPPSTATH